VRYLETSEPRSEWRASTADSSVSGRRDGSEGVGDVVDIAVVVAGGVGNVVGGGGGIGNAVGVGSVAGSVPHVTTVLCFCLSLRMAFVKQEAAWHETKPSLNKIQVKVLENIQNDMFTIYLIICIQSV
jgi:hypothetical protein